MTLIEILIVVSLVAIITLGIYKSLDNGLRVWERSHRLSTEEDVAILFEKISNDLRNAVVFSKLKFEGDNYHIAFPAIVRVPVDKNGDSKNIDFIDQIGRVEYSYDREHKISRRQANYSQALNETFDVPHELLDSIDSFQFHYIYFSDQTEMISDEVLDTVPVAVDVEVKFSTTKQEQRSIHKIIDIPVGNRS